MHSRRDVAFDPERMQTWPPAWGSTMLTAVDELPMATHGQPWPAQLPDLTYTGPLAELDLTVPETGPAAGDRDGSVHR